MIPRHARRSLAQLGLALVLGLSACKKAEVQAPAAAPAQAPEQVERDLTLWEVRKPGLEPSYLFGTCHAGVSLGEALPVGYEALLTEADLFVMEVDPGTMFKPEVLARLRLPPGQSNEDLLGAEDWKRLLATFDLKDSAAALNHVHPFVLLSELSTKLPQSSGGSAPSAGMMDLALSGLALAAGKQQAWLETIDQQLDVLLGQPPALYADQLRALLDPESRAAAQAQLGTTLDLCRTGDIDSALALFAEQDAAFMDQLMTQRNQNWIPVLEDYFKRGQVFVAAGAGHMIGDQSVVALLQDRGYKVTRMRGATQPAPPPSAREGAVSRSAFLQTMAGQLPTLLCTEAQPFASCFQLDATTCARSFSAYVLACGESLQLPEWVDRDAAVQLGARLGECTVLKLAEEHGASLLPTEVCQGLFPH